MNLVKKIIFLCLIFLLGACVNNKNVKLESVKEKKLYSTIGFALIYDDSLYGLGGIDRKLNRNQIVDNKLNNEKIIAMHSSLKKNTLIRIVNPENSNVVETKIFRKANYPKIFNIVLSRKIATVLKLDIDNPYVEVYEVKKNKTFIAKESNTFEVEKKVVTKVPIDEVEMDDISKEQVVIKKEFDKNNNFVLVISDFYFLDSANNLKQQLVKETKISSFFVRKINDNKFRLSVGPFEDFNALKSAYISLNNLGFEELNIYKE